MSAVSFVRTKSRDRCARRRRARANTAKRLPLARPSTQSERRKASSRFGDCERRSVLCPFSARSLSSSPSSSCNLHNMATEQVREPLAGSQLRRPSRMRNAPLSAAPLLHHTTAVFRRLCVLLYALLRRCHSCTCAARCNLLLSLPLRCISSLLTTYAILSARSGLLDGV